MHSGTAVDLPAPLAGPDRVREECLAANRATTSATFFSVLRYHTGYFGDRNEQFRFVGMEDLVWRIADNDHRLFTR